MHRETQNWSCTPRFSIRNLLIAVAVVAIVITLFSKVRSLVDPFSGRSFNRELWHQFHDDWEADNPRASMVSDLRWRYLEIGMSKKIVQQLLGPPDMEVRDDLYSYNLGMWSGFRIDYDSLDLYFDVDGKLSKIKRVQH